MKQKKTDIPFSILLADDDKDDRFFFERALKEVPIPTMLKTVKDGALLMEHLSQKEEPLPDVLFLDLNMPRKNGSECLIEIKQNKKLNHIPVIIYSTSLQDDIADKLYENGAHYYLQKCDFLELPKYLAKVLALLIKDPQKPPREKFVISLQHV